MAELYIVGIGPGSREHITVRALEILENADIVIGYKTYVDLAAKLCSLKEYESSGMHHEVQRCERALELNNQGKSVALVSSGDPGIYGMAGVMLEVLEKNNSDCTVEIIPGVTSASAAAALLGAPLMHDCAFISLSDLLTDWDLIKRRIRNAADGDFVICLYNPRSKKRVSQFNQAVSIIKEFRHGNTPVGIVKKAMREGQEVYITDLEHLLDNEVDMVTTVIIGNSETRRVGKYMVTPRGYNL